MAVTSINSTQAWRLALTGEAEVDPYTGEVSLTAANFAPGAGTPLDGLTVGSGPVDLSGASSLKIPAASPLNTYTLQAYVKTIVSATASVGYVVVPADGAGTIVAISAVCDAAPTVGSLTLTGRIATGVVPVAITNGVVTVLTSDVAGTPKSATPTAANVVAAGNVVSFLAGGTNTADGTAMITVTVRRSAPV